MAIEKSLYVCYALLVSAQGSWRWQKRGRRVRYEAVVNRSGNLVWGKPETVNSKISLGNYFGSIMRTDSSPIHQLVYLPS